MGWEQNERFTVLVSFFFKELGPHLTLVIDIEEETVNICEQSAH